MAKRRQQKMVLETRLAGYAATLSARAKSLQRRTGNWPIYAAATGSALAMATAASAGIITSGIVSATFAASVSVKPLGGSNSSIKGLQMGSLMGDLLEVNIAANSGTVGGTFAVLGLQPQNHIKIFFSGASSAKNFKFKSSIGNGLGLTAAPQAEIVDASFTPIPEGKFFSGKPGFAGLSISTTGHINKEYGWIELIFTESAGLPYDLRALAFGIDTNLNQTIQAGQIDNGYIIPEPGTMGLSILAAGAAGVAALRRRRRPV